MGMYNMTVQIRGHKVNHLFQFIQGWHEDTIMGINFINKHKMVHYTLHETIFLWKLTQVAQWMNHYLQSHLP
jgi:hypothetical protein